MNDNRSLRRQIKKITGGEAETLADHVALEEPLEIQLAYGPDQARQHKTVAITMRTPGHDRELATGFLVGEGILRSLDQVEAVYSRGPRFGEHGWRNSVRITLRPEISVDLARLERNFYTTSSCGICGKTSMEALEMSLFPPLPPVGWKVDETIVRALPSRLGEAQTIFQQTGGLHAAGLFTLEDQSLLVREDVGRHNAVDKVIGWALLEGRLPLSDSVLLVSGRGGFEIVQKAIAAGVPVVASVSAPSSLAVQLARELRLTLIGFLRGRRFVIYAGEERVAGPAPTE